MMMPILISVFVLILLIGSMFLLQWANPKNKRDLQYSVVSAGCADGSISLCKTATDITNLRFVNGGEDVRVADYIPYIVEGESMAANNIHTGDIVLTKDLTGDERLHLEKDNILVFTYLTKEDPANVAYKLRQFIDYLKISEEINVDEWCEKHDICEKEQFAEKYKKAKERSTHDSETYLCSKTWHNNKLDYSFHSIVNLRGRVRYSIPADKLR